MITTLIFSPKGLQELNTITRVSREAKDNGLISHRKRQMTTVGQETASTPTFLRDYMYLVKLIWFRTATFPNFY